MSVKKFKVGNRVRFIGDYTHYVEEALKNGEIYTISNIDDWGVELSVPMESHVDTEYLELAEPTDPRTAFLQELRELLSKYNATIFGLEMWASINGEQCVFENAEYLDSDNIMDYE